ncbi:hypothetical protein ABIB25_002540 [Nakamurella sp. UYEF19]|uniref:helicase-associated domain-containing protein n=1 Tax=Nakamurella sp. UYEF19 TaxID=1756392 RepID=UPI00339A3B67
MVSTLTLAGHLSTLSRSEFEVLLARRPETLTGWPLRNLADLATAWETPWSMAQSVPYLPLPAIEMLGTLAALVQGVKIGQLSDRLEQTGKPDDHLNHVRGTLGVLQDHGLAWVGQDGGIWISQDIDEMIPRPLGLGSGVDRQVKYFTVDVLKMILSNAGLDHVGKRADLVRRVLDFYLDVDRILALVAGAPVDVQHDLAQWAAGGSPFTENYDPANMMRVHVSFRWGQARGLLFGYSVSEAEMPAPIAMALRSRTFRASFHPLPPDLPSAEARPDQLDAKAGAAATNVDSLSLSVLDAIAALPIPLLAKGGVGVREVAKLAERTKAGVDEVRIVIELAFSAELLVRSDSRLVTGPEFARWRSAEPADRVAELLAAWWNLSHVPSVYRSADGKAQPALTNTSRGGEGAEARHRGVQLLAELPQSNNATQVTGTHREAFLTRLAWERPVVMGSTPVLPRAIWVEAHLLGVFADGACTPAGRALLTFDGEALRQAIATMLPAATTTASFGSDLTVMVAGAPTAAVAELLDACADRESRGQASLWRLSPAGVRRAMDNGWGADELAEALRGIASAPLPQPVTYLIGDVARRHGHVKVTPAGCCIISEDAALLVELCAARALRTLGLRLLAPTVLAANTDSATTLAALRTAGYMPAPGDDGVVAVVRTSSGQPHGSDHHGTPTAEPATTKNRINDLLAPDGNQLHATVKWKIAELAGRVFRSPPPKAPTLFP